MNLVSSFLNIYIISKDDCGVIIGINMLQLKKQNNGNYFDL